MKSKNIDNTLNNERATHWSEYVDLDVWLTTKVVGLTLLFEGLRTKSVSLCCLAPLPSIIYKAYCYYEWHMEVSKVDLEPLLLKIDNVGQINDAYNDA